MFTSEDVAIKLESANARAPQLYLEYRFYQLMGTHGECYTMPSYLRMRLSYCWIQKIVCQS